MNVFADLHQDDLYYSLHLLFEKRLGWNLYRPIGFDWYDKGFWAYSQNPPTVKQYLQIQGNDKDLGDHYECPEGKHGYNHKALTFDQFLKKDIDIVIASVTSHEEVYARLIAEHKPKAKLIRQAGNIHDTINFDICKNILASTYLFDANTLSNFEPKGLPAGLNVVIYHQEFELSTFSFQPPYKGLRITNLMNCVPDSRDYALWPKAKVALPEFDFKMYGILGDDGIIGTEERVAKAFHDTTFVWHVKFGGDGFGHVIHNAFATGRPPIVRGSYYTDKLAGHFFEDGVTCIDLEKHSFEEAIEMIRYFSKPENYVKMSKAAHEIFLRNVDFDKEFKYIKKFLDNLI